MNLWARTPLRQLTVLAVASFFFSCEDEASLLGFKNPNQKFKVNYVDIPLESSVFLMDSLRTSNYYGDDFQGETKRLLVGHYTDEQFGNVTSTAVTQFRTTQTAKTLLKETAVFDSISLQLRFDLYTYGGLTSGPQTISIHEVQEEMNPDSLPYFFNKTNATYNATPLGSKTFSYAPEHFKQYIEDRLDTTITVRLPLDFAFGERIFASAVRYRDANTVADSAFVRYRDFVKEFKGIAIVAADADKAFGFDPESTASRITLHYHDAETDSLQLHLTFAGALNYNEIDADRAGTALAGLNQYSQPMIPDNGLRYVQSGAGVLTRLDFDPFYSFLDADSNAALIVNSAELFLGAPEASSVYDPINAMSLRAIEHDGFFKKVTDRQDSISVSLYDLQFAISGGMLTPVASVDINSNGQEIFIISKASDKDYYGGFLTLFAQELAEKEADKQRFRYFGIFPESPQLGKSVNRMIFREENIKMRVYYTRPTEPTP